jgi:hypothetical protein
MCSYNMDVSCCVSTLAAHLHINARISLSTGLYLWKMILINTGPKPSRNRVTISRVHVAMLSAQRGHMAWLLG